MYDQQVSTQELSVNFLAEIPHKMLEVLIALLPVLAFFFVYQHKAGKLPRRDLLRIIMGAIYTYFGLVIFLTGASCGFMQTGYEIGKSVAESALSFLIVPVGCLIGYYTVRAEPAVILLQKQVEEITSGAIPRRVLGRALSLGVSISVGDFIFAMSST